MPKNLGGERFGNRNLFSASWLIQIAGQALYQISAIISPPSFFSLASLSAIKPRDVEIIAIPCPYLTGFRSADFTYIRREGFETRRAAVKAGGPSSYFMLISMELGIGLLFLSICPIYPL